MALNDPKRQAALSAHFKQINNVLTRHASQNQGRTQGLLPAVLPFEITSNIAERLFDLAENDSRYTVDNVDTWNWYQRLIDLRRAAGMSGPSANLQSEVNFQNTTYVVLVCESGLQSTAAWLLSMRASAIIPVGSGKTDDSKKDDSFRALLDNLMNNERTGAMTRRDSIMAWVRTVLYDKEPLTACLIILFQSLPQSPDQQPAKWVKQIGLLDDLAQDAVASFLFVNWPNSLRSCSVINAISQHASLFQDLFKSQDTVVRNNAFEVLKIFGRLVILSTDPDVTVTVATQAFASAHAIAAPSQADFLGTVLAANVPNLSKDLIVQMYKAAKIVRLKTEGILISMANYRRGHGVRVLDGITTIASRQKSLQDYMSSQGFQDITVESLIGDAGNFSCPDCMSVSSPSAYLFEALNFLPESARSHLLERRPDIAQLLLSCENTEVALPYLDTANEVMESFIHHLHDTSPTPADIKIDTFTTPADVDTEDLLVQDTNLDSSVYINWLQKAVFPFSLPYNLGLDKTRLLLKLMKTTRPEVMTTFQDESRVRHLRGTSLDPGAIQSLKADQLLVVANAVAAEDLGLSYADFVAITRQSYWPISMFDKQLPKPQGWTNEDYYHQIGGMAVAELWGFDNADTAPSPFQKAITASDCLTGFLLPRSGMSFKDYTALAKTKLFSDLKLKAQIDVSPTLNETACDRIQAFLRLRARLGWTIEDLDIAITQWQGQAEPRDWRQPAFLANLARIKDIITMNDMLDVTSLLSLWAPISLNGDQTLFKRLFLRRSIKRLDDVFFTTSFDTTAPQNLPLLATHLQGLLAATGCSKDGFTAILQGMSDAATSPDSWLHLSLANISTVYRCVLLAQIASIPQASLEVFLSVFPEIFKDPQQTYEDLTIWNKLSAASLSIEQVAYIIGITSNLSIFAASLETDTMKVAQTLNTGLLNLQQAPADSSTSQSTRPSTASEQLIVSAFATVLPGLDPQILQSLMRGIAQFEQLKAGSLHFTALQTLTKLPALATATDPPKSGSTVYLSVPSVAEYSFVVMPSAESMTANAGKASVSTTPPDRINIGGMPIDWLPNKLQDGSWESVSELLTPQTLYEAWFPTLNVSWRIKTTSKPSDPTEIPPTSKISKVMFDVIKSTLAILQKFSLILTTFSITQDEVAFLRRHPKEFWELDFQSITLTQLNSLAVYADIRDSSKTPQCANTILEVWKYAFRASASATKTDQPSGSPTPAQQISGLTGLDPETLDAAFPVVSQGADTFTALRSFKTISRLFRILIGVQRLGVSPKSAPKLFEWAEPTGFLPVPVEDFGFEDQDITIANSIEQVLRTQVGEDSWDKTIRPVNDRLRLNRRDAMIAYLLQHNYIQSKGITDADGLFEWFLIDVQMGTAVTTSRTKQAMSVVQVFIQRALLGEEPWANQGPEFQIDRAKWSWMQRYRVWEASRKIYLWPENWLSSALLDVKTTLFQNVENGLQQANLSSTATEDLLLQYMYGLCEISDLQYLSYFRDSVDARTPYAVHLFARTKQNPYSYYYRTRRPDSGWTPWTPISTGIPNLQSDRSDMTSPLLGASVDGAYLIPYVYKGRVFLFWPTFQATVPEPPANDPVDESKDNRKAAAQPKSWDIQLYWSEYRNGVWSAKQAIPGIITDQRLQDRQNPLDYWSIFAVLRKAPNPQSYVFIYGPNMNSTVTIQIARQTYQLAIPIGSTTANLNAGPFCCVGQVSFDCTRLGYNVQSANSLAVWEDLGVLIPVRDGLTFHTWLDGNVFPVQTSPNFNLKSFSPTSPTMPKFRPTYLPHIKNKPLNATIDDQSKTTSQLLLDDQSTLVETLSHDAVHQIIEMALQSTSVEAVTNMSTTITDEALGGLGGPWAESFHVFSKAYSAYSWDLGLFVPMLLVEHFLTSQDFENALKVIRCIFDPHENVSGNQQGSFWKWKPFAQLANPETATKLVFAPATLNALKDTAFDPHEVARARPEAYMRWVAMKYIEIMVECGDYYFRQNTLEMLPEAIQCYVEASHYFGPRQEIYDPPEPKAPESYSSMPQAGGQGSQSQSWQADFESSFVWEPLTTTTDFPVESTGLTLATMTTSYFCVPQNPALSALRDKIDDRLFKIRNSMDINGNVRSLPLFEPPIDPGLLVAAGAAGALNFSNFLADMNPTMINMRFPKLLQRALDLCSDLRSFGSSLMSAKSSKDAEALALLQASQATKSQQLVVDMKQLALEQANNTLEVLRAQRKTQVSQLKYLTAILGEDDRVPGETEDFEEFDLGVLGGITPDTGMTALETAAMTMKTTVVGTKALLPALKIFEGALAGSPTVFLSEAPLGVGTFTELIDAPKTAKWTKAASKAMAVGADMLALVADINRELSSYKTRTTDRRQAANTAGNTIKSIDKQIAVQQTLIKMANKDLANAQAAQASLADVETFRKNKFTNTDLYSWMESTLETAYYQTYTAAYDIAKKAELAYHYERSTDGATTTFIDFGYWDVSRSGALAGERLLTGLRKLQQAYDETRGYDFEIKKEISLRSLDPMALWDLRSKGSCDFDITELAFDMDFPGHYKRRIKSVAISFSGLSASSGSISATLTLTDHRYRISPKASSAADYLKAKDSTDPRVRQEQMTLINAVAVADVATAAGDAGVFSLDFTANSYVPFENAGAISTWHLELSDFAEADRTTITDVAVHLKYTACSGDKDNPDLKKFVQEAIRAHFSDTSNHLLSSFDLTADFTSAAWSQFAVAGAASRSLALTGLLKKLPFYTRASTLTLAAVFVIADFGSVTDPKASAAIKFVIKDATGKTVLTSLALTEVLDGAIDDDSGVSLTRWTTTDRDVAKFNGTNHDLRSCTFAVEVGGVTDALGSMALALGYTMKLPQPKTGGNK